LSGGGALLHDRELTYSMCLPAQHPQSRQSARLYGLAHAALIEVLAKLGVHTRFVGDSSPDDAITTVAASNAEPFLCFARRTPEDVVAPLPRGGLAKIAGSAQRRRRGAVLQHGAVLLDASPHAPELLGMQQCVAQALKASELIKSWCDGLAARIGLGLNSANESSVGRLHLRQDLLAKYAGAAWTERR
jgi:lipoate-protein ligase A